MPLSAKYGNAERINRVEICRILLYDDINRLLYCTTSKNENSEGMYAVIMIQTYDSKSDA